MSEIPKIGPIRGAVPCISSTMRYEVDQRRGYPNELGLPPPIPMRLGAVGWGVDLGVGRVTSSGWCGTDEEEMG